MKKAALAVIVVIFSYTLVDIMIWQRIFETHELDKFASLYHPGWAVMLACDSALGLILLYPRWRAIVFYLVSLYALAFGGLEDVLYYWLDGRSIPDWLPWLDRNPMILFKPVTSAHLLASASIWVGAWILFIVIYWQRERLVRTLRRATDLRRLSPGRTPSSAQSLSSVRSQDAVISHSPSAE